MAVCEESMCVTLNSAMVGKNWHTKSCTCRDNFSKQRIGDFSTPKLCFECNYMRTSLHMYVD